MNRQLVPPGYDQHLVEHPIIAAITSELAGVNALSTYWRESVRSSREGELRDFLADVAKAVSELYEQQELLGKELRNKIDLTHLDSQEFKGTLAKVCESAIREGDEAKKEYLRAFAINYARELRPDVTLRQLFFTLIDDLAGTHIAVLKYLHDRQGKFTDGDLRALRHQPERTELPSMNAMATSLGLPENIAELVSTMLGAKGLLFMVRDILSGTDRSPRLVIEPVGRDLVKFLLGNW
jgi:hypothetical protein